MSTGSNSPYPASMGVTALNKLISDSQNGVHALLDACAAHTTLTPQVPVAQAEAELLPELVQLVLPHIEHVGTVAGPTLVSALATAIVFSK